jgi:hypothetical protein
MAPVVPSLHAVRRDSPAPAFGWTVQGRIALAIGRAQDIRGTLRGPEDAARVHGEAAALVPIARDRRRGDLPLGAAAAASRRARGGTAAARAEFLVRAGTGGRASAS